LGLRLGPGLRGGPALGLRTRRRLGGPAHRSRPRRGLRLRLALGAAGVRTTLGLLLRLPALAAAIVAEVALLVLVGLEVGLVPAASLQAEHRCGHQLLQLVPAALGALLQRRVGDLLQYLDLRATGRALVFVERHGDVIIRTWMDKSRDAAGGPRGHRRPPR